MGRPGRKPGAGLPETEAAELPLAGGSEGARVKLHLFLCGTFMGPRRWFEGPPGRSGALSALGLAPGARRIEIPIVAFAIEHPSAGLILVDAGLDPSIATGGALREFGRLAAPLYREVRMEPGQGLRAQLRQRGLDPDGVMRILMTHLHSDHASGLSEFPGASVWVSAREWEKLGGASEGYNRAQLADSLRYRLLDFAAAGRPEDGFDSVIDIFGDGSVRAAQTPGHSPGHLSLIVRVEEGEALVTGDAAYTLGTLRGSERPWRSREPAAWEDSLAQLRRFDAAHPGATVIPGHDMATWEALPARM